jgi:hypothetical protein
MDGRTDGRDDLARNRNYESHVTFSRNIKCRIRHVVVTKTCHRCIFMKGTVRISLGNVLEGRPRIQRRFSSFARINGAAQLRHLVISRLSSRSRARSFRFLSFLVFSSLESLVLASRHIPGEMRKRGISGETDAGQGEIRIGRAPCVTRRRCVIAPPRARVARAILEHWTRARTCIGRTYARARAARGRDKVANVSLLDLCLSGSLTSRDIQIDENVTRRRAAVQSRGIRS